MGLLGKLKKKKEKTVQSIDEGVHIRELPEDIEIVKDYYVDKPISRVKIVKSASLGAGLRYFVVESILDEAEASAYFNIMKIISKETAPPQAEHTSPLDYIREQAERVSRKYPRALGKHTQESWEKIYYYVVRNLAGYGPLHTIMMDPNIEDISHNGVDSPVYIWHKKYESIPSNVSFTDEQVANDFILKLAHKSSKHISSAVPIIDGMLPEKHRLAATFMNEVSLKGSTFTIRKFRAEPFSIMDLIRMGTLDSRIAAYFWLLLEHKNSFMIIGGTGAGKTSILNSLLSLMSMNDKIVTVEEVPELQPPLTNWTQFHSRQGFNFGASIAKSISLFDLVKASLRYRPDYIIVGEVRGEEAYTLFQALATGHGGLCTMHADSLENVINRLTSPPMNVSPVYIPLMNSALHIQRVELPRPRNGVSFGRRVRTIWEIDVKDQYQEVAVWNPLTDTFDSWFENSILLERIAVKTGRSREDIQLELDKREGFLKNMLAFGVKNQKEVTEKILTYFTMTDVNQSEMHVLNNFHKYVKHDEVHERDRNEFEQKESINANSNSLKVGEKT